MTTQHEKTKNGPTVSPSNSTVASSQLKSPTATPTKLTKGQVNALFLQYLTAHKDVETADKKLLDAKRVTSKIIEQLANGSDDKSFRYNGRVYTIMSRTLQSTGEKLFLFRSPNETNAVEISDE